MPTECTNLTISAKDTHAQATSTEISYSAVTNGYNIITNETMTDIIVTGIATSHSFDQNTSYTDTVERVITFEFMDMTASTTITQGVWLDKKFIVNLNDQWQLSSNVANPDSDLYDGVYESFSNLSQSSTGAIMYVDIEGYSEFTLYIRSYGESHHDYVMAGQLDVELTNDSSYSNTSLVKAHTKGNPVSSTDINSYTKVTYENIDEGKHRICIIYRKDSSGNSNEDRGYLLIPKNQ